MPKHYRQYGRLLSIVGIALSCCYCTNNAPSDERKKGLINEGMTKAEVEKILGTPQEIDTTGVIYDVALGKKTRIERWRYPKRTAVFMNDTLRSANSK